ncbi:MAG: hypothetical protein ACK4L7_06910, partial [Flavobacteriales bacterium]
VTMNHCYGNFDPRTFTFIASNPGETLTLTFVSGTMDSGDLIRGYSGTDNTGAPITDLTGSFANLASPTVTGTSTGNELFLEIDSDGSNSCQDGSQTTWVFEVECTPGCVDPDGTATYDPCTQEITVDLNFDGDGATAGIRYIVNGGPNNDITGLNAPHTEVLGPFSTGDVVQVYLLHETDGSCNKNLGSFTITPIPTPLQLVATADPTSVCPGGSSQLNAVLYGVTPPAVPAYVFEQHLGTYTPITGGTVYGSTTTDDQRFVDPSIPLGGFTNTGPGLPIGFDFTFNNQTYDRIGINANGWISFGLSTLTPSVNMASSSAYFPLSSTAAITPAHLRNRVAGFGRDIQGQAGSEIRMETIGSAPNRVCVIQWTNYKKYGTGGVGDAINFQIRLYESSNTVELHYGPMTWNTSTITVHVGLGGSTATQFNNRQTTTDWNATTAGASNTASCTINNTVTPPAVGRIFRWRFPEATNAAYSWDNPSLLDNPNIANPLASGIPATTTFTVTATSDDSPCPSTQQVTVTVVPPISAATISPDPAEYCQGGSVTLTANPTDGLAPYTYQWYDPSSNPAGTAQTQAANLSGTWSVDVTDACSVTVNATVSVSEKPTPTATASSNSPICEGQTLNLEGSSDLPGSTFAWTGPGGFNSTLEDPTIPGATAANSGVYSLVATYNGCSSPPAATTVSVNYIPTTPTLVPTVWSLCPGGSVDITANSSVPGSGTIGTGTVQNTGTTYPTPYGAWFETMRLQYLFTASELTALGLVPGGYITSAAFFVANVGTAGLHKALTIRMGNTSATSLSTLGYEAVNPTPVFGP